MKSEKQICSAKSRNLMYEQQMKHLPTKTVENLKQTIETKLKPDKFALILHDKDTNENGSPVEPHVHAMMSFSNARHCTSVAKLLNDKPERIELWNDKANNGYAYLIHATENSRFKFQYSPAEVIANFNYPLEMQKIAKKVEKSRRAANFNLLLDALYEGSITKDQLERKLSGSQIGQHKQQIENVWGKRLQRQAEEFRQEMERTGKQLVVIWVYGKSGVGKTSLAVEYAKKNDRPFYISGSSRDIFQNYAGEHILILDELRPSVIPYQDLLRITDPYGRQVMAPSRYCDKALAVDTIIITSPYNPFTFYMETPGLTYSQCQTDSFVQLLRRLTLIIKMDNAWINEMAYDSTNQCFIVKDPAARKKNKYSSANRAAAPTAVDPSKLFNSMFE